ncbi:Spy/CpxP family protein refolding chaperone [[Empedobacter] haloabium]|uniref:Spy/CpxP family protein refolding chaperone n=1 Tax=[Empedobacter] haloabium TaxID=592317 RepID=A0ABZ1USY5_9BURK
MNKMNKMLTMLAAAALALPLASHAAVDGEDGGPAPRGFQDAGAPETRPLPPRQEALRGGDDFGRPRGPHAAPPCWLSGAPGRAVPFLRGLELTETQEDKVFAILHAQAPYLREQHKAHEKAERALFALHGAAKYDDAAAAKLAQASAQAMANITLQHLRTEQKVLAVLTAEQRKQVEEAKARPGRPARP